MANRFNVLHGISQIFLDGVDLGYTEGGVEIEKSFETFEKEVDQELDALDVVPTKYSQFVRTSLAESSLANIKRIWNEPEAIVPDPGPPATETLHLGCDQEIPEHELKFFGKSPAKKNRKFLLWRAKSVESSGMSLQKGEKIVIPVVFRCLPDFDKVIGKRYGYIEDET